VRVAAWPIDFVILQLHPKSGKGHLNQRKLEDPQSLDFEQHCRQEPMDKQHKSNSEASFLCARIEEKVGWGFVVLHSLRQAAESATLFV
jgi:hypothetical protein